MDTLSTDHNHRKGYLTGKLLTSTPFHRDNKFSNVVIYLCGHDEFGAIGLVINQPLQSLSFHELLSQLSIPIESYTPEVPMFAGGPMEVSRGFVLHSKDFKRESTVEVDKDFSITATLDILRAIAADEGPKDFILSLGYASWVAGQLEQEIQENFWMVTDAETRLIYDTPIDMRWKASLAMLGIEPTSLSLQCGSA